jgi:hypothetical protein
MQSGVRNMPSRKPWFGFHMPNFTCPGVPRERLFERGNTSLRTDDAIALAGELIRLVQ